MARVLLKELQQWFERSKLEVGDIDFELEATAVEMVFAKLSGKYSTTTWVDVGTTPRLVRKILSMLYAAWYYQRQYSEENPEEKMYGVRLEERARTLVDGVLLGALDLVDVEGTVSKTHGPVFWPTDATGSTQQYDAMGNAIGREDGADRKFSMGMLF